MDNDDAGRWDEVLAEFRRLGTDADAARDALELAELRVKQLQRRMMALLQRECERLVAEVLRDLHRRQVELTEPERVEVVLGGCRVEMEVSPVK